MSVKEESKVKCEKTSEIESEEEFFETENKKDNKEVKMQEAKSNEIRLPIFEGQEYSIWKKKE